jgi:hypothetical protein
MKIATFLTAMAIVSTASTSYGACRCVEGEQGSWYHNKIVLTKIGTGPAHMIVREFRYDSKKEKQRAWQKCQNEAETNYDCR